MQPLNENDEPINMEELKLELKNLQDIPTPTEEELVSELETAYQQANASVTGMADINFAGVGDRILKKLRNFICKIIGPGSSSEEIIDAIIDALVSLLPGGVLVKPLVKKIAKFIFDKGIGAFCQVQ